jgi:hypothetical protein
VINLGYMATETIQKVKVLSEKKLKQLEEIRTIKNARNILKQARVLKLVAEHPDEPISKAMVAVGYAESSARTPSRYIGRENLLRVFLDEIPDKLILKAHKKLLKSKVKVRTYVKGSLKTEYITEDTLGLSKGVELAYKVKGAFAPEEKAITITGLEQKGDDELDELIRQNTDLLSRSQANKPDTPVIEGEILANTTP